MTLRPTTSNREACIDFLLKQIALQVSGHEASIKEGLPYIDDYIFKKKVGALASRLEMLSFRWMMIAYSNSKVKKVGADFLIQKAFAYGYWAAEIDRHDFIAGGYGYDAPNGGLDSMILLHGLAVAGEALQVANCLGPYLYNYMVAGGPDVGTFTSADPDYKRFIELILTAQVKGKWLDVSFNLDELDQFKPLIQATTGSADSFRFALDNYCDLRLSQSFGYDTVDAPKRRSRERAGLVFNDLYAWWTLMPTELFSLQYAFKQATGKTLSLEADHPLLKNPAMQAPPLWPLYEDELTQRVQAMGREVFGSDWKPLTKVPLVA